MKKINKLTCFYIYTASLIRINVEKNLKKKHNIAVG